MKTERSAGVVVYIVSPETKKPEYLLLHYVAGHWDLPKGHIEEGEDLKQAAIRETKEETGLEVTPLPDFEQTYTYYFKDKNGKLVEKTVTFFIAPASTKEVALSPEHIFFKWLPIEDALKQLSYNNTRQLLQIADQYVRSSLQ